MTLLSQPTSGPAFVWPLRYIGDDWAFPYTYTNPDGSPRDITGASPEALLFARDEVEPVFAMAGATGVTIVLATAGQVIFTVSRALTATLRAAGRREGYPTRIQVQLLDGSNILTTLRVDGVPVEDARFAPLSIPPAG